jgi:hypothetical protein
MHAARVKEALSFSETSVLTKATWRKIPEETILHSHLLENLKSYMLPYVFLGDIASELTSVIF